MITPDTADQEQHRGQGLGRPGHGDTAPGSAGAHQRPLWSLLNAGGRGNPLVVNVVVWLGAALMVWSAAVHLHLWSTGYRHIATIGPLFLLQGIAGIVLAVVVALTRRVWSIVAGAGFLVSTVAGFLISVNVGLFGFQDTWVAPTAKTAFGIELAGFVVLAVGGALCLVRRRKTGPA